MEWGSMFCIHLGSRYSSYKCIFYLNKFTDYDHGITLRKRKSNPNPGLNPTLNLPNSEVSLLSFAPIYLIYYMESYVWNLQYDWSVHFKERHKDQYTERTGSRSVKEENGSINCRLALILYSKLTIPPHKTFRDISLFLHEISLSLEISAWEMFMNVEVSSIFKEKRNSEEHE